MAKPTITDKMILDLTKVTMAVVADIETTGTGTTNYEDITQISGVLVDFTSGKRGKNKGTFDVFCKLNRRKKMPKDVAELTGITDEKLEQEGIPVDEALRRFYQFTNGYPIIFHNYAFDWKRFLVKEFERIGLVSSSPIICTLMVSKKLLKGKTSGFKLGDLVNYYGGTVKIAHNALEDCINTAAVAYHLQKDAREYCGLDAQEGLENLPESIPAAAQVFDLNKLQVKHFSYWKKHGKERIYVTCNAGNIFFDLTTNTWQAKTLFGGSVDWSVFERLIFRATRTNNMAEFVQWAKLTAY